MKRTLQRIRLPNVVLAGFVVCPALVGCTQTLPAYQGPERAEDELAVIKCCIDNISRIMSFKDHVIVYDESRDSDKINPFSLLSAEIALAPGKYSMSLQSCGAPRYLYGCAGSWFATVELEAGHVYEVAGEFSDQRVKDRTTGKVLAQYP